MARLVSYKVNNDSTYSTFDNEHSLSTNIQTDATNDNNFTNYCKCFWQKCCCCYQYDSNEAASDDIEFALIKYSQVQWCRTMQKKSINFK